MATAYNHIKNVDQRLYVFIGQRINEIDGALSELESEKMMWEEFRKKLNRCPHCSGEGKLRKYLNEDDYDLVNCSKCLGTGVNP